MMKNSKNFSQEDIRRLANGPAAQQLMQLLRSDLGAFSNAMEQAASGNYRDAIDCLSDILSKDDAKTLLAQLGGRKDG